MNKANILKEIKTLIFGAEEKFEEVKSGDLIIRSEGDSFKEEEAVYQVTEEGLIPLEAGEYKFDDGRVIVVDLESKVQSITEAVENLEEEKVEEEKVEEMEVAEEEKVEEEVVVENAEKDLIESLITRLSEIEKVVEEMSKKYSEVEEKTEDFSKIVLGKIDEFIKDTPADLHFKSMKSEYKGADKKEKSSNSLSSIKNLRKK